MNETPQQIPNQQPVEPQPEPEQQIPVQPEQPVVMPQQPQTKWLFLVLGLVVALAAYAGVAYWQGMWPFEKEIIVEESPTPTPAGATDGGSSTSNLETYQNNEFGFEFKHDSSWSIASINTGSGYNASQPFVVLWAGTTSDAPCQDLNCPPKSGDRDELTKGDTLEGAPPLNPWFKILRVRGNKWVSIQVTDVKKNCSSETVCQQYLSNAPFEQKLKMDSSDYQTYNDFIELISTFKFTN